MPTHRDLSADVWALVYPWPGSESELAAAHDDRVDDDQADDDEPGGAL